MSCTPVRRGCAATALGVAVAVASTACGSPTPPPASVAPSSGGITVTALVTPGPTFSSPLDAVPASDGSATWFTASGPSGPGVFVTVGGNATPVAVGAPFDTPTGLALTADDQGLLVADPGADTVFTLPAAGGPPVELPGTAGTRPRGVEVAGDRLYVTGTDPVSGSGAVFVLPVTGGPREVVATGLTAPDGVTIAPDGAVIVTDQPSSVLRIENGSVRPLAVDVRLGNPAGLTLTVDASTLLVSSLHPTAGTAQVLALDPVTGAELGVYDDVIRENHGAGGLHRAHDAAFTAWADVQRPGWVYRVDP